MAPSGFCQPFVRRCWTRLGIAGRISQGFSDGCGEAVEAAVVFGWLNQYVLIRTDTRINTPIRDPMGRIGIDVVIDTAVLVTTLRPLPLSATLALTCLLHRAR